MDEKYYMQVNTPMEEDDFRMLEKLCLVDERNRSQMVRWLIRNEYARRGFQQEPQKAEHLPYIPGSPNPCDGCNRQGEHCEPADCKEVQQESQAVQS